MPLDTVDQLFAQWARQMATATTSYTNIQWNRIGPQATLLMPLNGLTGSIMALHDLTWLTKEAVCKSRPA